VELFYRPKEHVYITISYTVSFSRLIALILYKMGTYLSLKKANAFAFSIFPG